MPANSAYWKPVWQSKVGQDPASASGRSGYEKITLDALANDAIAGLRLSRNDSLLDVGCATGMLGERLRDACGFYVGLDYVPDMASGFSKRCGAMAVAGEATALPFADASFDKAIMSGVTLHMSLRECEAAIIELRRVTRRIAFIGGNVGGSDNEDKECRPGCICNAHVLKWQPSKLVELALACGWRNTEIRLINPTMWQASYQFDLAVEV